MSVVLGIDCATSCGCAVVSSDGHREALFDHWTVDLGAAGCATWARVAATIARAATHCTPNELVVAIELPYLDPKKGAHVLEVLARFAGRFEQAAEAAGATVVMANAATWQAAILGRFGGRKRTDRKKAAALWARALFGPRLGPDEADAAGLAVHVLRQHRFDAKVAKASHK